MSITKADIERFLRDPVWIMLEARMAEQARLRTELIMRPFHDDSNSPFYTEYLRGEIASLHLTARMPEVIIAELEDEAALRKQQANAAAAATTETGEAMTEPNEDGDADSDENDGYDGRVLVTDPSLHPQQKD